jgi:hypothetical protein
MANKVDFKYHLFFSYCHKNKEIVHNIYKKLKQKYKIWIDINVTNGKLYREMAKGIEESQIFVCFVSKEYCESETCCKEIQFAYDSNTTILPIMLDREAKNEVEFFIRRLFLFMACKPPNVFEPWSDDLYRELDKKIGSMISNDEIKSKHLFEGKKNF